MAASILMLARQISPPNLADRELLDRFIESREHEAFAELVRRHGPVVYRICRRLVGPTAADDAFQATFLLLSTRTAAAKAANSVGGWLVGVAGRVARQIRRSALRRQNHETKAATRKVDGSVDIGPELIEQFRILDEELANLPERLRDPIVSCLLQGHTQEEMAARSGLATRTIRRRLDEAKRLLRIRLLRRGVIPALAAGLVSGIGDVASALPTGLAVRTIDVVFDFLNGGSAITTPPIELAKGVAKTMLARKLIPAMVALALGFTGLGFVLAEDPKPNVLPSYPLPYSQPARLTAPQTMPSPAAVLPISPQNHSSESAVKEPAQDLEQKIKQLEKSLKTGEVKVILDVVCVKVPEKFCDECGLFEKPASDLGKFITSLNQREAKMLNALIRVTPNLDLLSRPSLAVLNEQTGYFHVGSTSDVPVGNVTDNVPQPPNLKIMESNVIGQDARLTPKIDKDTGKILLKIELNGYHVADQEVSLQDNTKMVVPIHTAESIQTMLKLSSGETAVIKKEHEGKSKKSDMLWIITPHLVQAKP